LKIFEVRNRVFAAAILAAGVLYLGSLSQRGFAQDSHPAAQSTTPAAGNATEPIPSQPGNVKNEEEEEHNVYRHTALVMSISDAIFHDDKNATDPEKVHLREKHIEKTARSFEWINAIIIWLCIIVPLAKFLPKVLRKRSQTLSSNLEHARKATADANARLSAVEAQLSRLDEEIAKIRTQVEEDSKQDEVRIKASIGEESARIVASAEQEITQAAAQAQRGLKAFAADLAIEQAAKQLTLTPEADSALIAQFIREASNGAAKGGQK
jgi:F-type H+-transporting ATPase subunit b